MDVGRLHGTRESKGAENLPTPTFDGVRGSLEQNCVAVAPRGGHENISDFRTSARYAKTDPALIRAVQRIRMSYDDARLYRPSRFQGDLGG